MKSKVKFEIRYGVKFQSFLKSKNKVIVELEHCFEVKIES